MPIKQPSYVVLYQGTDITKDLQPYLSELTFTDVLEGESDTLSIVLENRDNRWMGEWLPGEGDTITASLGYSGGSLLGPIDFEIDEVSWRGQPDTFEIRALATPITKALRQRNAVAYEDTTLKAIAQTIADKHELTLVGELPNIKFDRVTQKSETDLSFLRRLASDYGVSFKIDSLKTLVFFRDTELEALPPSLTITRAELSTYSLSRSATATYKQAKISYQGPDTKFIDVTVDLEGAEVPKPKADEEGLIASGDILNIQERVESLAAAKVRAVEALKRANKDRVKLSADMFGEVAIAAGQTFTLEGFQRLSGKYLVTQATHALRPQYTTNFEARKIES